MLGLLILGATTLALVAFVATQLRANDLSLGEAAARCPTCRIPMIPLTSGPSTDPEHVRSYDVLACPSCTNAVTMVHGTRSQCAYCPACHQRTLETPCIRRSSPASDAPEVEVREHCHICGYEAIVVIRGEAPPEPTARGQVIRFPPERTRSKK